mmetsp:Transcript_41835/g.46608  ORF Transcript_41835/g.46608 Transcript_41835/m.46608 type:complete len:83 (+) Transcript_41835:313-561(+)
MMTTSMPLHSPPPPPVCVVRFDSRKRISRRTVGVAGHIRRSELVKNSIVVVVDWEEAPSPSPVNEARTHATVLSLSLSLSSL